jgi:uncharacterized protein (TIGR03083 family)
MSARERLRSNALRFLAVAGTLRPDEWAAPSLCADWTNHDLLAHLVVGYGCAPGTFAAEIAGRRGSFNPANTALAWALATSRDPAELLADFAALAERPRGIGRYFPRRMLLGDRVTHEIDIPAGRRPRAGHRPRRARRRTEHASVATEPVVPAFRNSRGLAHRHGYRVDPRRWTRSRGQCGRSGLRAGQPAESSGRPARRRRCDAVAAGAQPPDPYGRVMISR